MQFCVTFIPLWEIFYSRTYRVWSEFWILSPIRRLVQAIAVFSLEIQRCCFFTASHIPQQRKPCAEVRQPQADCLASGRGLILAGSQEEFNSFKYDLIWLDHSLWPPTIFNQHQSTHGTPRSTFFFGLGNQLQQVTSKDWLDGSCAIWSTLIIASKMDFRGCPMLHSEHSWEYK